MSRLNNPHPLARCPYCGATKAVVTWGFCSEWCRDYAVTTPRAQWEMPDAPVGAEEPFEVRHTPMVLSGGWF